MTADRQTYSRYQILCAEREAWLDGETADDDTYYYDGISFWRCDAQGQEAPGALLADTRRTAGATRRTAPATCAPRARRRGPLSVA